MPLSEKISISLPQDLAQAVRRRAGARGLSSFFARAAVHELEREQLAKFLKELDEELDPVSEKELGKARRAWPKR